MMISTMISLKMINRAKVLKSRIGIIKRERASDSETRFFARLKLEKSYSLRHLSDAGMEKFLQSAHRLQK